MKGKSFRSSDRNVHLHRTMTEVCLNRAKVTSLLNSFSFHSMCVALRFFSFYLEGQLSMTSAASSSVVTQPLPAAEPAEPSGAKSVTPERASVEDEMPCPERPTPCKTSAASQKTYKCVECDTQSTDYSQMEQHTRSHIKYT